MKSTLYLIFILLCIPLFSQEKKEIIVKTDVNEATVFMSGAQIVRKKSIDINKGTSTLKFVDLSPFIDPQSIQFKIDKDVIILSVNHQYNYLDSAARSKELESLHNKLKAVDDKLKIENANLAIISEELTFLKENRNISGKNQEVSLNNLKETSNFYKEKMTSLIMGELEVNKRIEKLADEKEALVKQIMELNNNQKLPISEILVKIEARNHLKCETELSYYVNNAGWHPSYDIRSGSIDKPIELVYKANIYQNTREEWKNIKLRLSSTNPKLGGVAPKLYTYFLNYYSSPNSYYNYQTNNYTNNSGTLKGKVFDASTQAPIPFAGVVYEVNGKQVGGSSTDFDGEYTIKPISPGVYDLRASFVGYNTVLIKNIIVNPDKYVYQDIYLQPSTTTLSEVTVKDYQIKLIDKDQTKTGQTLTTSDIGKYTGRDIDNVVITTGGTFSTSEKIGSKLNYGGSPNIIPPVPYTQTNNQTSFEFEIKLPYTINSDNKITTVDIEEYSVNAEYEYYCVPKLDKDAFLVATIVDWEKYNLLEGEASIYFENTYVGKSILDVKSFSDTLTISLGRDKNVVVKREKIKEYTSKKFLGSKKEETKAWKISVKNNKNLPLNMTIFDQVPVSSLGEIEVSVDNISGALYNKENGEIKWKFNLEQSGKKEFELKYSVKYPKDRTLTIE